jgi:histone deacetylase 1/2
LDTVDVISYIIAELDHEYDGFATAINALLKAQKIVKLSEVYSHFMSYESRMEGRNSGDGLSVNSATRGGRGGGRGRGGYQEQYREPEQYRGDQRSYEQRGSSNYRGGYRGGRGNGGRNPQGNRPYGGRSDEICQVCGKTGHTALNCWKRFNKNYRGPEKSAGEAYGNGSYGVDTNWYSDSGATDHVTSELEKLHVRDRYHGNEQIHTTNGTGMDIRHVGHSVIHTPNHDLHLKNILHVPTATKSLLSTSRLTTDNHAFVEYWPDSFFVKDQDTREILLQGRCVDGLYPMPESSSSSLGRVFIIISWTASTWSRQVFIILVMA